jgi:hypothetical protein
MLPLFLGLSLIVAAGCSQAPQPVTRKAATAGSGTSSSAPAATPATRAAGDSGVARSSEAEPKSAATAPGGAQTGATGGGASGQSASGVAPGAASQGPAVAGAPPPALSAGTASNSSTAKTINSEAEPKSATGRAMAPGAAPGSAAAVPKADSPASASGPVTAAAQPIATSDRTVANSQTGAAVPIDPAAAAAARMAISDPSVVMVDAADADADEHLTLAEAAKAERERKASAVPPKIVINDKTIHRYAQGGQLTVAAPKKKAGSPAAPGSDPAAGSSGKATTAGVNPIERDETYWRGRSLEIRQRWRKAADRIKELEGDINLWRRRFYAEDDPYVRDGQIKPAWDRALDELRESRAAVVAAKKELADFQEEGRAAGALPGWMREGVDLEPKEEKPVDPVAPIDTPIYKDPGR